MYVYIEKMISDGNESNTNRVFIEKDKYDEYKKDNLAIKIIIDIKNIITNFPIFTNCDNCNNFF